MIEPDIVTMPRYNVTFTSKSHTKQSEDQLLLSKYYGTSDPVTHE